MLLIPCCGYGGCTAFHCYCMGLANALRRRYGSPIHITTSSTSIFLIKIMAGNGQMPAAKLDCSALVLQTYIRVQTALCNFCRPNLVGLVFSMGKNYTTHEQGAKGRRILLIPGPQDSKYGTLWKSRPVQTRCRELVQSRGNMIAVREQYCFKTKFQVFFKEAEKISDHLWKGTLNHADKALFWKKTIILFSSHQNRVKYI